MFAGKELRADDVKGQGTENSWSAGGLSAVVSQDSKARLDVSVFLTFRMQVVWLWGRCSKDALHEFKRMVLALLRHLNPANGVDYRAESVPRERVLGCRELNSGFFERGFCDAQCDRVSTFEYDRQF
jgi:hypothetical protein